MCTVHVRINCSDTNSELILHEVDETELTIESIIGTALLEVFDTVHVERVIVHHTSSPGDGRKQDTNYR